MTAELLMLIGGSVAFLMTIYWVRRRKLAEKHGLYWLMCATGLLVLGLCPDLLKDAAGLFRLSYVAAVLFPALSLLYVFSMCVSHAFSEQRRQMVRLVQESALLRLRVDELERDQNQSSVADIKEPHGM